MYALETDGCLDEYISYSTSTTLSCSFLKGFQTSTGLLCYTVLLVYTSNYDSIDCVRLVFLWLWFSRLIMVIFQKRVGISYFVIKLCGKFLKRYHYLVHYLNFSLPLLLVLFLYELSSSFNKGFHFYPHNIQYVFVWRILLKCLYNKIFANNFLKDNLSSTEKNLIFRNVEM